MLPPQLFDGLGRVRLIVGVGLVARAVVVEPPGGGLDGVLAHVRALVPGPVSHLLGDAQGHSDEQDHDREAEDGRGQDELDRGLGHLVGELLALVERPLVEAHIVDEEPDEDAQDEQGTDGHPGDGDRGGDDVHQDRQHRDGHHDDVHPLGHLAEAADSRRRLRHGEHELGVEAQALQPHGQKSRQEARGLGLFALAAEDHKRVGDHRHAQGDRGRPEDHAREEQGVLERLQEDDWGQGVGDQTSADQHAAEGSE